MPSLRHCTQPYLAIALLSSLAGCVKEISSEERLEQAAPSSPAEPTASAEELARINCNQGAALAQARNVNRPEKERLKDYAQLYVSLRDKVRVFEEAMSRNPDLQYLEGSGRLTKAREGCVRQTADVRLEFERYVRELVDVPTVQEVKRGSSVTVARIDFNVLREVIRTLDPADKESLLARVSTAEERLAMKKDEPKPAPRQRRRRGR